MTDYNTALRRIQKEYGQRHTTKKPVANNLICQFCKISYNTASRYKVLKCPNNQKSFTHSFVEFKKVMTK